MILREYFLLFSTFRSTLRPIHVINIKWGMRNERQMGREEREIDKETERARDMINSNRLGRKGRGEEG